MPEGYFWACKINKTTLGESLVSVILFQYLENPNNNTAQHCQLVIPTPQGLALFLFHTWHYLGLCTLQVASVVSDSAILRTVACQASLSSGFSRQDYWSGLSFPPPRDLPHPGIKLMPLMSPALVGRFFTTSITWEDPLLRSTCGLCHSSPLMRGS